jgi:hypothetical protein
MFAEMTFWLFPDFSGMSAPEKENLRLPWEEEVR